MGGYKFWEFCASDAGSLEYAFPAVGKAGLFASDAPGFEPALVAAQDVGVGLVDGLLQFGDGCHLVGQPFVEPEQVAEA